MYVSSPAFRDGETITRRFTCDGDDASPEIVIDQVPPEAKSLAMIVDDPDAPSGTFVHWLLWNVPATITQLPEGVPQQKQVAELANARQGTNDFHKTGYGGPCPPDGEHHYRFHVYAVDRDLVVPAGAGREELERALQGHVLAEAELVGTYSRPTH